MTQPKKANVTLTLDQVPIVPEVVPDVSSNGDQVFADGDERWRFDAVGTLKYYIRMQAGRGRDVLPYEAMYSGPR